MNGTIFQFPDFDDPLLADKDFFFRHPQEFYDEYCKRFPNEWSAVSWEYVAALDIWLSALEKAQSLSAVSVLAAMKQMRMGSNMLLGVPNGGAMTCMASQTHWWEIGPW